MPIAAIIERLQGDDLADRDEAADDLQDIASDGLGAPLLVDALQHKHGRVRREAAIALGMMRQTSPEVVHGLCHLFQARSDKLKRVASQSLARLGRPAVPALLEALEGASPHAQHFIVWALGQIRDKAAQEPLTTLFWDSAGRVAKFAARALARIDFQATLHSFSEASRGWSWERQALKGRNGLLQLGIVAPNPIDIIEATVMGGDSLTAFEISQGKGNQQVLLGAIRGLGERRDKSRDSINVLLDALEYDSGALQSSEVRREAVTALRRIKGTAVREGALQIFQNRSLSLESRSDAALLLGLLQERQARTAFRDCLCDIEEPCRLRDNVARFFSRLRNPAIISDLLQGLAALVEQDEDNYERSIAQMGILEGIRLITARRIPEEMRFAQLREALAGPQDALMWSGARAMVEQWPEEQNRELAIQYANQHVSTWDPSLKGIDAIES